MQILSKCSGIIGILAFIYYIVITLYAGLSVSYGWLWLLLGAAGTVFSILFRKTARIGVPMGIFLGLAALVLLVFLATQIWIIASGNKKPPEGAEAVIVLGAQVRGKSLTKTLRLRLDGAISYLQENEGAYVIVSGGQGPGEDISEAEAMKQYLMEHGISENIILLEDKSTTTDENLKFSRKLLEDRKGIKDVSKLKTVIATNRFHVGRAVSIAKKHGFGMAYGLGVDSGPVLGLHYYAREALAVWKNLITGKME